MEILTWYFIFALATGLTASYELFWPVIKEINIKHSETKIGEHPYLSVFVATIIGTMLAPIVLPICIVPSAGHAFRNVFKRELISN